MKKMLFIIPGVFLIFSFLIKQSMASYAKVNVQFDWYNLDITGNILWCDNTKSTITYAQVWSNSDTKDTYNVISGWSDISSSASIYQGKAISEGINETLYSFSQVGPYGQVKPYSYAYSIRSGSFSYSGSTSGDVTFSLPIIISYEISASSDHGAFAYADIMAYIRLERSGWSFNENSHLMFDHVYEGESYSSSFRGILSVTKRFSPGDNGYFKAEAIIHSGAYSAVPLPSTLILVATGFITTIGLRRIKS